jgi:UDP-GlcNAc:undecaprenyl-phosphate GlcNAc-1-phosphate transferase
VGFPINAYLLATAGGFFTTLAALPLWRAWSMRVGLVDDPGHRKIHAEPIPLAGGLAVFTGLLVPLLFAGVAVYFRWVGAEVVHPLTHGLSRRAVQLLAILLGAFAMVLLGWLDDRYDLRPSIKIAGQLLVAAGIAASGIRITLFVPSALFSFGVTVLWILTVTNAFNLVDNMNGLCTGLGAIAAFYFGQKAAVAGHYLVASMAFLTVGALLGFLPYNFPRASAFLGDAGSHLIGYLLAVLSILPHFYTVEGQSMLAVLNPLLILLVTLGDMVWVVLIRWRAGRPFYVGDTNHLSHRLVRRGFSRTRAVLMIWLLAAATGAAAFL